MNLGTGINASTTSILSPATIFILIASVLLLIAVPVSAVLIIKRRKGNAQTDEYER